MLNSTSDLTNNINTENHAMNALLTGTAIVTPRVMTHFVDLESGIHGVAGLVSAYLTHVGAVYPLGIENTSNRPYAIAGGVFPESIIAFVQSCFAQGTLRYSRKSMANWISTHLVKKGVIGKICLSDEEHIEYDLKKVCGKARTKIYLVAKSA